MLVAAKLFVSFATTRIQIMKEDVLLLQSLVPALEQEIDTLFTPHRLYAEQDKEGYLSLHGSKIRGVITGGAAGISNAMLERLPRLEIVAINGIGTDAVDLEYARSRGIHVSTTPDVLTDDVADLALGLMLATLRGLCTGDRYVRAGLWGKQGLPLASRLSGKQVGIIGLGKVGKAIAKRLTAFDCIISYCNRRELPGAPYRYEPDLLQLARDNDILVLAASADHGRCIVDATVLDALGPQGVLVNVARGKLVDEPALILALQEKRIAGAGLDVFENEPVVPAELLSMENVVLQPHRGSATQETRLAMGEIVLANLKACFAGEVLPTAVIA